MYIATKEMRPYSAV